MRATADGQVRARVVAADDQSPGFRGWSSATPFDEEQITRQDGVTYAFPRTSTRRSRDSCPMKYRSYGGALRLWSGNGQNFVADPEVCEDRASKLI